MILFDASRSPPATAMKQFKLEVKTRTESGRGPARRARASGLIPANIYGKSSHRSLAIEQTAFRSLWKQVSGMTAIVEVHEEGREPALSIIQEVQRDPITDAFIHVDLHEVSANETFTTSVVVHVVGEAIGVRVDGGVLEVHTHSLKVRALPRNLPSTIDIDVSELHSGQAVHVRDLLKIEGVDFLDNPEVVVVSCVAPRAAEAAAEGEAEAGAAAPAAPAADKA